MNWKRLCSLASTPSMNGREVWIRDDGASSDRYDVAVRYGKKTDLLKLKSAVVAGLRASIEYHQRTRSALYVDGDKEEVTACPVCGAASTSAVERVVIHGASYQQCGACTHVFVRWRPTRGAITQFYLSDTNYASTYTDRNGAEHRLHTIAEPWQEWMTGTFKDVRGRAPRSVLDVGCGAGHFVEACRRAGLDAAGNEISEASRKFARDIWGLDLDGRDFTAVAPEGAPVDVVTFWGLLEHTPDPSAFLKAARARLDREGMVIAKLPRWDSLSTASQMGSPTTVIRHLDPMGHIMCFTDASAAELFHRCGFRVVAAWYYGMDVYELITQACNTADRYEVLTSSGTLQMTAQAFCDLMRASDGLVVAAVPR